MIYHVEKTFMLCSCDGPGILAVNCFSERWDSVLYAASLKQRKPRDRTRSAGPKYPVTA